MIRSVTQRHGDTVAYLFCGSQPTLLGELFEHPEKPLLPPGQPHWPSVSCPRPALGNYIEARFAASNRDVGEALGPLLDLARGHPRAAMILAHAPWEELGESKTADSATWQRALARMPDYVTEDEMHARWDALTTTQQKVAEVVARHEGSPFSVAILSSYSETKESPYREPSRYSSAKRRCCESMADHSAAHSSTHCSSSGSPKDDTGNTRTEIPDPLPRSCRPCPLLRT